MQESVYFNKERSIGQLFDFHQKVQQPHHTKNYRSDQTVNILKINSMKRDNKRFLPSVWEIGCF